jgi:arginine N-succinyltransferase
MVMKDKRFIADLMPKHPIYIPLLPKEAQAVIGEVHPETKPAIKLLEGEGFAFADMVDIFEGGPIVSCATDEIRTVRESRATQVYKVGNGDIESDLFILSNTYANGYRACAGPLLIVPGKGIQITKETAAALKVKKGDPIRMAPLRPGTGREIL